MQLWVSQTVKRNARTHYLKQILTREQKLPFCITKGQFKLARILLIWNEHIFALQTDMEEHEHFGVEGSGTNTVVVPFKQAQLFVTAVLSQQPFRVCFGHKGVINCMTCNATAGASATTYTQCAAACLYVSGTYHIKCIDADLYV